jgi:hypothetical protein
MTLQTKVKKDKAWKNTFFKELYENCCKDETYSLVVTIESMGATCNEVNEWLKKNRAFGDTVVKCRKMCADRAKAAYQQESDFRKARKLYGYWIEGDDIEAEKYAKEVEKERLEHEARAEVQRKKDQEEKELRKKIILAIKSPQRIPQGPSQDNQDGSAIVPVAQGNPVTFWQEQRSTAEEERVRDWREKQATEIPAYHIKKNDNNSTDDIIYLEAKFDKANLTPEEQADTINSTMCAATGTAASHAGETILTSAISGMHKSPARDAAFVTSATTEALLAMKPTDIFEGQLCSHLWVLSNQAMSFLNVAANPDVNDARADLMINRATKLLRLHNETLDVLNKHRRKGQQTVTVQHVNVEAGGQAIVGNVSNGRGSNEKS